ncbi:MAG TPA: iron-sulfur cluster repair di-iron protein [Cyclobacteriaceae bacterium]
MHTETQSPEMSVAEVAIQFPHALKVFNKYRIDYCCGGQRSFDEACNKAGVTSGKVWEEITTDTKHAGTSINFKKWSPSLLVDYILDQHHAYVKEGIPMLYELLDKICNVHGEAHPELYHVRDKFQRLAEELIEHMNKEERVLFPAIKMMLENPSRIPLEQPLSVMMREHEGAGNLIKEIRQLTSNYTLPSDVCTTYSVTFRKLEEFDNDLMQHIHLENNILFEKISKN